MLGRIFDISEFSLNDGPGIRTTVFFKGCPLSCEWCHNPEGQSFEIEVVLTDPKRCKHCGACQNVCLSKERCIGCGNCLPACPEQIRQLCGYDISVDQLIEKIEHDLDVYKISGGGVTLSGGEPLSQSAFLLELLEKIQHIHIALDTCGFASEEIFAKVISKCNLVLFDVKHLDTEKHKAFTGVGIELIQKNFEILKSAAVPFIVRVPLIPGFNDNDTFFSMLCERVQACNNLIGIDLLSYHRGARVKYQKLGKKYLPSFKENVNPHVNLTIFERYGIRSALK